MEYVRKTINRSFLDVVEEKRDAVFLTYRDEKFSWKAINKAAEQLAVVLKKMNLKSGSRIAIWAKNSPLYISAFFAIQKVGCTAVLINPAYKTYEMNRIVEYAHLEGVFCDENTISRLQNTNTMVFLHYIGMDQWEELMGEEAPGREEREYLDEKENEVDVHDFACMLFTSGTTGGPKGIELTHFQLLNVAKEAVEAMRWGESDRICMSLPMFHSFGLSTGLLASLFHKGVVCINDSYKSEAVMNCVERNRCTVLNGVPTMFLSVLYNPDRKLYDLSSLVSGIIAGSGVYESDFLTIAREFPIPHLMQSYGQTEASPSITFSPYDDSLEKRAKSVGVAIPGVEIRITDLQTGDVLPPGQDGEVEIRGFNTMKGYYNLNKETGKVMRKNGWMCTGDVGRLDESGYLFIRGRKKEMIIRGGENISPQEIEEILLSMDGVRQAKVFGVCAKVIQEDIAACIETDREYTPEKIKHYVKKYLADYKIPKYISVYRKFPETDNGKIDGLKLRKEMKLMIEQQEEGERG